MAAAKYTYLGATGLRISRIGVGCMSFGDGQGRFNFSLNEEESLPVLEHCYNSGLNFFDTANVYSNGISEEILGKAIKKFSWQRERLVIATKVWYPVGRGTDDAMNYTTDEDKDQHGYINQYTLSRKHIFDAVESSLKRLGLEYIDLLQIHNFDAHTPPKETMEALHDVVKSGKVRYIGACNLRAWQLLEYQYTARLHNYTEFVSLQNLYNATFREEESEIYPLCRKFGMGGIPWSPVAMGFLVRPWTQFGDTKRGRGQGEGFMGKPMTDADKKINEKIEEIAKNRNTRMAVVALAWCLSKPFISSPIVGLTKKERVDEALEALNLQLTPEEVESIDSLYVEKRKVGGPSKAKDS